MPYSDVNTLFDDLLPAGLHHYWKGQFAADLSDGAIEVLAVRRPRWRWSPSDLDPTP